MFGSWTSRVHELAEVFQSSAPFPHVVIPDFLAPDVAEAASDSFPDPTVSHTGVRWFVYDNPIEAKFLASDVGSFPSVHQDIFRALQDPDFVKLMAALTGIPELEVDPHVHGGGLHFHPAGGKLDMHLDYSIHPITGKERRVNIILYLNKDWDPAWGGALDLYASDASGRMTGAGPAARVTPRFNTAAIFRTSDSSWHGLPDPITCPPHEGRRSLAIYYVSEPRPGAAHRLKADFQARPSDRAELPGLQELRLIRPQRLITADDVARCAPWWSSRIVDAVRRARDLGNVA